MPIFNSFTCSPIHVHAFHAHNRPTVPYTVWKKPLTNLTVGCPILLFHSIDPNVPHISACIGDVYFSEDDFTIFHVTHCELDIRYLAVPTDWVSLGFFAHLRNCRCRHNPIQPTPTEEISDTRSDSGIAPASLAEAALVPHPMHRTTRRYGSSHMLGPFDYAEGSGR